MSVLSRDLTCQQAVELVTDYLEDRMPRGRRRRFEKHLRGCPNCTAYLDQIRTTIRLTGQVEPEQLDASTRDGLIDLYRRFTAGEGNGDTEG